MMTRNERTILSDWLELLGVPYTPAYTDNRFATMPFHTVFGMQQLLKEYGVGCDALRLTDRRAIDQLTPPFVAQTPEGMVIVTSVSASTIDYVSQGERETIGRNEFDKVWNGVVVRAFPTTQSREPDYRLHRRDMLMTRLRDYGLIAGIALLLLYLFFSNGIWRHLSTVLLTLFDIAGLGLTYMLVQKSLKIRNRAADKVCKVLQEGGCDTVLEMKASKFFGIFGWSEVGFAYFSVSLLGLLIFPECIRYLAVCNLLCLPFTFWSIWYQKFRAKVWCTLCVSVQCTLWLLFFCYWSGGWIEGVFPLRASFFVLGVVYLTTLLALNKILPYFTNRRK